MTHSNLLDGQVTEPPDDEYNQDPDVGRTLHTGPRIPGIVIGTGAGTIAAGDDSRITGAAQKAANLSDLASASAARANLGLGGAAVLAVGTTPGTVAAGDDPRIAGGGGLPVGTTAGTVAAGNDTRITGAAQKAANLSDLASAATARTNLGLGAAATKDVGTTAGTVMAGDDIRIGGAAQKAANLSDLQNAVTARTNLGLSNVDNTSDVNKPVSTAGAAADLLAAKKAANLSDLASAATARTNLGLGAAAVLAVGTTAGTVMAGDDARVGGAALKANNLSDLASAATARTNLGLGAAATLAVGTTAGTVMAGDDARIAGAALKAANLSDLASAATARTNLGLGGAAVLAVGTTAGTVAAGDDSRITNAIQKGTLSFDARDYGLLANGTDDCAHIQAAIAAASTAGGGVVTLPPGTITLSSAVITLPSNVELRGAGSGKTVLLQAYWPNPSSGWSTTGNSLIMATGTAGTPLTSAAVVAGATTITGISSTAGLAAGGYVQLGSHDFYWDGYPTRYKGEILRILSVDSGTAITVTGIVRDDYSTTVTVTPLTMVTNVGITGLTIRNTAPASTHATGMIWFQLCRNIRVSDVELIGSDFAGVRVTSCHNGLITNTSMYDFTDISGANQLGYGVLVDLATEALIIEACRFIRVRHGVTTGGYSGGQGGPRDVLVTNCIAQDCSATAFDTHQTGGMISFIGNSIEGCRSAALTSRSTECRFIGNTVSFCQTGVAVWGEADGVGHGTIIQGNVFRHIWGDYGVRIHDADSVSIVDNTFFGTDSAGVYITENANRLRIIGNRFENIAIGGGSAKAGVQFAVGLTSTGHLIERNTFIRAVAVTGEAATGPGLMDYAIRNLSTGVTGSWFANNTVIGTVVALVSDLGGNVDWMNVRLDQPLLLPAHAAQHSAGGSDRLIVGGGHDSATRFDVFPRVSAAANIGLTAGTLYVSFFTAPLAHAGVTTITVSSATGTGATGTTLGKLALYSVDGSGNITLLQASANNTALFAAANTLYTGTITSTPLVAGQRYAIGILLVGNTNGFGRGVSGVSGMLNMAPAICNALTAQTDIPSTATAGALGQTGVAMWAAVS